jgi:acyl carrier protein
MSDQTDPALPTTWPSFSDPSVLEKIIDVIAREGAVERASIVPTATLDSLSLASLDVVTILMGVEEELNVYIPMSAELSETRNLAEFVGAIAGAMTQAPAKPTAAS